MTSGNAAPEERKPKIRGSLGRWVVRYFALVGVAVHLGPVAAVFLLMNFYQVSFQQLVLTGLGKFAIDAPVLVALVTPGDAFPDYAMDGRVRGSHPRIVAPVAKGDSLLESYQRVGIQAPAVPCGSSDYLMSAICWYVTGDAEQSKKGISALASVEIRESPSLSKGAQEDDFDRTWRIALAYDLLYNHPAFTDKQKQLVGRQLENAVRRLLFALDGDSLSLWHSRSTTAHIAWLAAIVLDQDSDERKDLVRRAQAHYLESVKALALTEGWPEGYNYWINSRGFLAALAGSAYVTGLDNASNAKLVRTSLSRVAYWTIYLTRPDNRVEGVADEGPRVDLQDETRRVIDLIARLTRDPLLAGYSRYLAKIHRASYYRGYRWSFFLANDPTLAFNLTIDEKSLHFLNGVLPLAAIFGRGAFNQVIMRSGWGKDDTFISYHAGKIFTHHGHYDAGHFSLFKGAPLALNSSVYDGNVITRNRLNYSIRTVAKNSLLILRPGERVQPNRFFPDNVADGGQRVVIPTGSSVTSLNDWFKNASDDGRFSGGEITDFALIPGAVSYVASDLTKAYNTPAHDSGGDGGKVRQVTRQLLYLIDEDVLFVSDAVSSVDPSFTKKWLLHTANKPDVSGLRVLKGNANNGILSSMSDTAVVANGTGRLVVKRILPEEAEMRVVGGPDYQYYVEADGDDSDLDGTNMIGGAVTRRWFDIGWWRLEIQPVRPRNDDRFLIALTPSLQVPRLNAVRRLTISPNGVFGAATSRTLAIFSGRDMPEKIAFTAPGNQSRILITGLPSSKIVRAETSSGKQAQGIVKNGLVDLLIPLNEGDGVSVVLGR